MKTRFLAFLCIFALWVIQAEAQTKTEYQWRAKAQLKHSDTGDVLDKEFVRSAQDPVLANSDKDAKYLADKAFREIVKKHRPQYDIVEPYELTVTKAFKLSPQEEQISAQVVMYLRCHSFVKGVSQYTTLDLFRDVDPFRNFTVSAVVTANGKEDTLSNTISAVTEADMKKEEGWVSFLIWKGPVPLGNDEFPVNIKIQQKDEAGRLLNVGELRALLRHVNGNLQVTWQPIGDAKKTEMPAMVGMTITTNVRENWLKSVKTWLYVGERMLLSGSGLSYDVRVNAWSPEVWKRYQERVEDYNVRIKEWNELYANWPALETWTVEANKPIDTGNPAMRIFWANISFEIDNKNAGFRHTLSDRQLFIVSEDSAAVKTYSALETSKPMYPCWYVKDEKTVQKNMEAALKRQAKQLNDDREDFIEGTMKYSVEPAKKGVLKHMGDEWSTIRKEFIKNHPIPEMKP